MGIKLATCPTFEKFIQDNLEGIKLIPASSTSECFYMMENNIVDYILVGRTPKIDENYKKMLSLGKGYSFLYNISMSISIDELKNMTFFTNLDDNDIFLLKQKLGIKNIEKIDDVYSMIDQNIIITSWENTNYNKGAIVHVFKEDGERYMISREPFLYTNSSFNEKLVEKIRHSIS